MRSDDLAAADAIVWRALGPLHPAEDRTSAGEPLASLRRGRLRHLLATDPGGAWVAEADGAIVGVALALIREGVWGLSLLAVDPDRQGRGIGGAVLAPALAYGNGARGGIILGSTDPRALRRYARAGFRAKPCLAAAGPMNRSRVPAGLRSRRGDPEADRATIEAASRHARGAAHGPDVAVLGEGGELFVLDGRGFAMAVDGSPALVAARDDDTAQDLLWTCLASAPPGGTVHVEFITEGNDWAIDVALDAGLALSPEGPVFVRGDTGPFAPYLPSGAYL